MKRGNKELKGQFVGGEKLEREIKINLGKVGEGV